jgi:hypothetical protein
MFMSKSFVGCSFFLQTAQESLNHGYWHFFFCRLVLFYLSFSIHLLKKHYFIFLSQSSHSFYCLHIIQVYACNQYNFDWFRLNIIHCCNLLDRKLKLYVYLYELTWWDNPKQWIKGIGNTMNNQVKTWKLTC